MPSHSWENPVRIKPFKALRPREDIVRLVASVPYDTVDSDEARKLASGNPWSFLRIVRPEVDLPEGLDPHCDEAYSKSAENFRQFQHQGVLVREETPCLYVYRQKMGGHVQSGIVACCHVNDCLDNLILKHERTRADKEDDRTRHINTLNANTGPVFLAYRDVAEVDRLVAEVESGEPMFDIVADDGVTHTIWRAPEGHDLMRAFESVPVAFIADGHHRSAAAVRVALERRQDDDGTDSGEYEWFLTVLFPSSQLQIMPYNRCVTDLNGKTEAELLVSIREKFSVTEMVSPCPGSPCHACMYMAEKWYGLRWTIPDGAGPVDSLDVSYLQDNLLKPILDIDDPRTSDRISFVGGIRGTEELANLVDSGKGAVAFSMYPVTVEQMMAIADAGEIMPPKSTWFEPKLRSGLLIHTL
jgi:uncharacterized protein (DUF1015 family)